MGEMMTRQMMLAVTIVALQVLGASSPTVANEQDKLVGTWKLISAVSEDIATGQKTNIYKGPPLGFITYGADGRMMTIIVDSSRRKPAGPIATAAEAEALFRSMAAYAGTYTIKGNQVIHRPDA